MKPSIICCAIFIFLIVSANAQLEKGNWLVGGNASFSSSKQTADGSPDQTTNTINIAPNLGFFFIDKLAAGIQININSSNERVSSFVNNQPSSYNIREATYGIGPFARYYFLSIERQLNVFAQAGDNFNISTLTGAPSSNFNTYYFSAGPAFYFNEHVGLEFTVGYSHTKYTSSSISVIQIGFGFQIHLKKGG